MPMLIEGLACFGAFGAGAGDLTAALEGRGKAFAPLVDTAQLTRYIPARTLRQCDRFSRLALLGACAALESAGVSLASLAGGSTRHGVVLASGYGTAAPTLEFLDSLEDFGEALASPLAFSHSVHNIPAAIVAKSLGVAGPCSTVCQFEASVAAGLMAAEAWLDEGRVDRVIFGAVEEVTPALEKVTGMLVREKKSLAARRASTRARRPLAEGAVFFCLSREASRPLGCIESVVMAAMGGGRKLRGPEEDGAAVWFLSGMVPPALRAERGCRDGSAAYGNLPVAQAFDCVLALSLLGRPEFAGKLAVCEERNATVRSLVTLSGGSA